MNYLSILVGVAAFSLFVGVLYAVIDEWGKDGDEGRMG